jgi:hypothetical protein
LRKAWWAKEVRSRARKRRAIVVVEAELGSVVEVVVFESVVAVAVAVVGVVVEVVGAGYGTVAQEC